MYSRTDATRFLERLAVMLRGESPGQVGRAEEAVPASSLAEGAVFLPTPPSLRAPAAPLSLPTPQTPLSPPPPHGLTHPRTPHKHNTQKTTQLPPHPFS